MAQITRHGLYGGARSPYVDFTGKVYTVPAVDAVDAPRKALEVVSLPMVRREKIVLRVPVKEEIDLNA